MQSKTRNEGAQKIQCCCHATLWEDGYLPALSPVLRMRLASWANRQACSVDDSPANRGELDESWSLKTLAYDSDLFIFLQAACFAYLAAHATQLYVAEQERMCNVAQGQGARLNWVLVDLAGHGHVLHGSLILASL